MLKSAACGMSWHVVAHVEALAVSHIPSPTLLATFKCNNKYSYRTNESARIWRGDKVIPGDKWGEFCT